MSGHEFNAGICGKCGCLEGQDGSRSPCPTLESSKERESVQVITTKDLLLQILKNEVEIMTVIGGLGLPDGTLISGIATRREETAIILKLIDEGKSL